MYALDKPSCVLDWGKEFVNEKRTDSACSTQLDAREMKEVIVNKDLLEMF